MRISSILYIIVLFSNTAIEAQRALPGGVQDAAAWVQSGADQFLDVIHNRSLASEKHETLINFHPAYIPRHIAIDFENGDLNKATFFAVVNTLQKAEQPLWQIEKEQVRKSLMTTHRIADLHHFEFLNLSQREETKPYISTYYHHLKPDSMPTRFVMGPNPGTLELERLSDGIGEVIVFDRVIAPQEKARIESYLSLKFGIPLDQSFPTHYFNSMGDIIWNAVDHRSYPKAIAGLGRDIISGLDQKQSSAELITMYVGQLEWENDTNPFELPNNQFLFWSHNGNELQWTESKNNNIKEVRRKWKVVPTQEFRHIPVSFQMDANEFPLAPQKGESLWLYQYEELTSDLELDKIKAYPLDYDEQRDTYTCSSVYWDQDQSGSDLFTIAVAPAFHAHTLYHPPTCGQQDGRIELKANGGKAPFTVQILNEHLERVLEIKTHDKYIVVDALASGRFSVEIHDALNGSFYQDFQLNPINGPNVQLESTYELKESLLQLDISEFIQMQDIDDYYWELPSGERWMDVQLSTDQLGLYRLVLGKSGCVTVHDFDVIPSLNGNLKSVNLYPNPFRVGTSLYAFIELKHISPVNIKIVDEYGRIIDQTRRQGETRICL